MFVVVVVAGCCGKILLEPVPGKAGVVVDIVLPKMLVVVAFGKPPCWKPPMPSWKSPAPALVVEIGWNGVATKIGTKFRTLGLYVYNL
jgi:hypothetical protein